MPPLKIPLDIQLPINSDEGALFDFLNTLIPKIMHMCKILGISVFKSWQNISFVKDESTKAYLCLNATENYCVR